MFFNVASLNRLELKHYFFPRLAPQPYKMQNEPQKFNCFDSFLLGYTKVGSFRGWGIVDLFILSLKCIKAQKPGSYTTPNV